MHRGAAGSSGLGVSQRIAPTSAREAAGFGRGRDGRTFFTLAPAPFFQHTRLQPFLDEGHDASVSDLVLDELDQPILRESVKKA
jgi:hypothetical protein